MSKPLPTLAEIEETFSLLDEWEERYAFLLDLARHMPPLPDDKKTDAYLVPGCVSKVWLVPDLVDGHLNLKADSDAQIVRGLVALMLSAYNGQTPQDVEKIDLPGAFARMGLETHLSPNRRNGFFAMIGKVQQYAKAAAH
jgi:cysteine desulfuration protein SufE